MIVVNVPEPAIKGKAIGTMLPDFESCSPLKNSTPNTISNPSMKITIEPAMANELISNPNNSKNLSPIKKNPNISSAETNVACTELISPIFFFNDNNTGTEPSISITAKSVSDVVIISANDIFSKA